MDAGDGLANFSVAEDFEEDQVDGDEGRGEEDDDENAREGDVGEDSGLLIGGLCGNQNVKGTMEPRIYFVVRRSRRTFKADQNCHEDK